MMGREKGDETDDAERVVDNGTDSPRAAFSCERSTRPTAVRVNAQVKAGQWPTTGVLPGRSTRQAHRLRSLFFPLQQPEVQPLTTVDNSSFFPNRLTDLSILLILPDTGALCAPDFEQRGWFWPFRCSCCCSCPSSSSRLSLLWRLGWLSLQPFHAQAGKRRPLVHRLLKPRTPLDCPICRLCSSAVRPVPAEVASLE
jgi:hypothetical protein